MKVDYFAGLSVPGVPGTRSATGDGAKPIVAGLSPVSPVSPVKKDCLERQVGPPVFIEHGVNALPDWCRSDCHSLEVVPGAGAGCVRVLADGPWREEWRRLDTMMTCPKRLH